MGHRRQAHAIGIGFHHGRNRGGPCAAKQLAILGGERSQSHRQLGLRAFARFLFRVAHPFRKRQAALPRQIGARLLCGLRGPPHPCAMSVILPAILPVFIMALLGFALAKSGRPMDGGTTAFLVATVGTPALVFSNLATTPFNSGTLLLLAAATVLAIAFYLAVGAITLKASGLKLRTYLPSLSFPNAGNLGLPLALYA